MLQSVVLGDKEAVAIVDAVLDEPVVRQRYPKVASVTGRPWVNGSWPGGRLGGSGHRWAAPHMLAVQVPSVVWVCCRGAVARPGAPGVRPSPHLALAVENTEVEVEEGIGSA